MSLRKGLVRKMRFFWPKSCYRLEFWSYELSKCAFERSNQSPQLWGGGKNSCGAPRAKKWSKIKKLPFLSQKTVQPAICPKALHRGSETSLQHTNAVQAPFMIECHSHKKIRKILILAIFGPKWWSKISAVFWKLFKIDFRLIFDRSQNRRTMSYGSVRGLLGPHNPKIIFTGRIGQI